MEIEEVKMPYREKVAWLSLVAMIVTLGPYLVYAGIVPNPGGPLSNVKQLIPFGVASVAQMLILAVGHIVLRIGSPDEARIPADERDKAIMHRSLTIAYYVLMAGAIMVGIVMPFTEGGWKIINATIFMIVIAQLVQYGVQIFCYRWQA